MRHELKTWPEFFRAIIDRRKTFEVRKHDRPFNVGDTLHLRELSPASDCYTGAETDVTVTYVMVGGKFGVEPGFCVMGIEPVRETLTHVERKTRQADGFVIIGNDTHR